jgi:hypothetical protein
VLVVHWIREGKQMLLNDSSDMQGVLRDLDTCRELERQSRLMDSKHNMASAHKLCNTKAP